MEQHSQAVSQWYDGFSAYQKRSGINIRHRTILRNAREAGMRDGTNILEIGCGAGMLTSLLARRDPSGSILAVDISPKSIEIAKERLTRHPNVRFLVTDMRGFESGEQFDLVILPDVIEHIPLEQHPALFRTIAAQLRESGRVLINLPCAQLLEHLHVHDPSVLQVIDQPVHADILVRNAYDAGLVLESFKSYSLQFERTEYHSIVLRHAYHLTELPRKGKWALRRNALLAYVRSL